MVNLQVTGNPASVATNPNVVLDPASTQQSAPTGPATPVGDVPNQFTPAPVMTTVAPMTPEVMTQAPSTVVATSDTARNEVGAAEKYLADQNASAATRVSTATTAPAPATQQQVQPKDNFKLIESIAADLSDAKVSKKALRDMSDQEASLATYKANMRKVQRQLDTLQKNMEARTAAQVEDIKSEYESIMEEQRMSNKAYERGVFTAGLVSGREMYAPDIQSGIMAQAVNYGISKLTDIQRKRSQLINEAYAAQDERNYQLLTAKMAQIRQTYTDERDTTLALRDEMREASRYEREMYDYQGKNLAPYVVSALTGNDEQDDETYLVMAKKANMPEAVLRSAVDSYKREREASLPASIQEYNYLRDNGMLPAGVKTFTQYQNYGKSSGSARTSKKGLITAQQAANAGLNWLKDVSLDEFISESTNYDGTFVEKPPAWFKQALVETGLESRPGSAIDVNAEWNKFKNTPGASKLITGYKPEDEEDTTFSLTDVATLKPEGQ